MPRLLQPSDSLGPRRLVTSSSSSPARAMSTAALFALRVSFLSSSFIPTLSIRPADASFSVASPLCSENTSVTGRTSFVMLKRITLTQVAFRNLIPESTRNPGRAIVCSAGVSRSEDEITLLAGNPSPSIPPCIASLPVARREKICCECSDGKFQSIAN